MKTLRSMHLPVDRRRALRLVAVGAGVVTLVPGPGHAQQQAHEEAKKTKEAVHYRYKPKDGNTCSACVNFIPETDCKKVEGPIDPGGWCELWTAPEVLPD
ncbi:MAG: hypothetical protein KDE35_07370 [Geminicoccaceae bacterium]|nr:hypothetical protein [Geminicoccaceae bacterium]